MTRLPDRGKTRSQHIPWRAVWNVIVCGTQFRATRRHLARCPLAPPRGMDAIGNSENRRRDNTGFCPDGQL